MRFFDKLFRRQVLSAAPSDDDDEEMVSLVVLSNDYVELTLDTLRQHLDSLFPGEFLPPNEASFVVEGAVEGVTFLIKSDVVGASGLFMLHSVPGPYTEFSNFAEYVDDPKLLEIARSQNCWLSVDLMSRIVSDEEAYRFIGNVLALLAPDDAEMLVHPSRSFAIEFDSNVRRQLAAGEAVFGEA